MAAIINFFDGGVDGAGENEENNFMQEKIEDGELERIHDEQMAQLNEKHVFSKSLQTNNLSFPG